MRIYVDSNDVMAILGCKKSYAYEVIKDVNAFAKSKKLLPFPDGKANKYLLAEMYGIPSDAIDEIIER